MLKGIFYTAIAKYSGVLISLVIGAILARLLTPEEFGIVALVFVFVTFFNLLGNFGLGPAIVQRKDLSSRDIRSIFSFSLLLAIILSLAFYLSAGWIANFYNEPVLIPIVRILSLSILFNVLRIVPGALFVKKLEFKKIGIINLSVQLLSGIITIILAYSDFGYFALVYKSVLDGVFLFGIYYILNPIRPVIQIIISPIKKIASFSIYQFGFNFINYFSRNLDNILIGKYLGNSALGYYNKSYGLMMLPVGNLTNVITPVLHPVLSNHQDDKPYIYRAYIRVIKILAMIGFPLSVYLYFAAPELIMVIYGSQWRESVPVFQILAFTIGFQICLSSSGSIFQAIDRTDLLFLSGGISACLMISGITYGIFVGKSIEAVGFGLIGAFVLNFFQGFYLLIHYALNQSFIDFMKSFLMPIFVSILVFVCYYFLDNIIFPTHLLGLVFKSLIFGILLILAFLSSKDTRNFLFNKLMPKKH
jgi:teichuronic acid exporter